MPPPPGLDNEFEIWIQILRRCKLRGRTAMLGRLRLANGWIQRVVAGRVRMEAARERSSFNSAHSISRGRLLASEENIDLALEFCYLGADSMNSWSTSVAVASTYEATVVVLSCGRINERKGTGVIGEGAWPLEEFVPAMPVGFVENETLSGVERVLDFDTTT